MVKTPPAPIVTEEATTPSTASVCSDEQSHQMPGTPQSMGELDGSQRSLAEFGSPEPHHVSPISPNLEQVNVMLGQPMVSPMCTTVVLGLPPPVPSPTGNMLCVGQSPLPPAPVAGPPQSFYRVAYVGGIDVRAGPSVNAPKTGITLRQNEIFAVAETVGGVTPDDLRVYLRLSDGRGWAFDDKALHPHDPSVVRGHWQAAPPPPPQQFLPPQPMMMPMQQGPTGYPMPPAPQPYTGHPTQFDCNGMPCYPMYGEQCQMPLQPMNLQECDQLCYPPAYTDQAPRKWKRGKRGGAKRRPKTQVAGVSTENTQCAEIAAY